MRSLRMLLLAACTAAGIASPASAVEIHGTSSTQAQWFTNYFNNQKQFEIGQYVNASVTKIDEQGKISLHGYGRMTQDLTNGEGLQGRLFFLYADFKDLDSNTIDIRMGRQFVNYSAGSSLIDGLKIDLKNVGPVAFSVMGGRNITYDLYNEATKNGDFAFGVSAYLYNKKNTDLDLSWYHKIVEKEVAQDIVGASFKQYFDSIKLYGNTRYDTASRVFGEVLTGVSFFPVDNLIFSTEWYQSYPMFDATSIYSVFAVDRYQEGVFKVDYRINKQYSVNAGYTRQSYGYGVTDVIEMGVGIRPMDDLRVNLNYDYLNGYDGKNNGARSSIEYDASKDLSLSAGFDYNVAKYDATTGEVIARSTWAGGKYQISKTVSVSGRVENNINSFYKHDWRGRFALNVSS